MSEESQFEEERHTLTKADFSVKLTNSPLVCAAILIWCVLKNFKDLSSSEINVS